MSTVKAWQSEYIKQGTPSSFREAPSGTVSYFLEFLKRHKIMSGHALDLGCGRGRNSFFLAENGFSVEALDFVPENVAHVNREALERCLPVRAHCQSVTDNLPLPDQSVSVAIDIFCYKHQTNKLLQESYRKELYRVLRDDGFFALSLAGDDDGFYGPLLERSADRSIKLVTDPVAKVDSLLYSKEEIQKEFSDFFEIVEFQKKRQLGIMHGKEYLRTTFLLILCRC